jgi:SAM-dependent methyltransferase
MTYTSHAGAPAPDLRDIVREYYGKVLSSSDDLKTNACCPADAMPRRIRDIVELIEPEIVERFYGCGSPIPPAVEGRTVLDLGCGTGRDAFVCSRLVGEGGMVIGVDMTDEQLEVGRRHLGSQTERFGYRQPNVALLKGYMEDLGAIGITDESVTVRAFKLGSLEDRCEDYGQVVRYRGSINGSKNALQLDDHHLFEKDRQVPVCGNTAAMLSETRLAVHFDVTGDRGTHFGLFDCADRPIDSGRDAAVTGCC